MGPQFGAYPAGAPAGVGIVQSPPPHFVQQADYPRETRSGSFSNDGQTMSSSASTMTASSYPPPPSSPPPSRATSSAAAPVARSSRRSSSVHQDDRVLEPFGGSLFGSSGFGSGSGSRSSRSGGGGGGGSIFDSFDRMFHAAMGGMFSAGMGAAAAGAAAGDDAPGSGSDGLHRNFGEN